MRRVSTAVAGAVLLAACGSTGPKAPAPSQATLAYGMPATNPLVYASTDSLSFNIEVAPGQSIDQTMDQQSKLQVTFAPMASSDSLALTARYLEFQAAAGNSMQGQQTVGLDAVKGDYHLAMAPSGAVTVVDAPEVPKEVAQLGISNNRFTQIFPRLPARAVQPGASWTDTIHTENEQENAKTVNDDIVHSTFTGDTVVNGHKVWVITSRHDTRTSVHGQTQGMDMTNDITGSTVATTYWDPARKLVLSHVESGMMKGTFNLPGAGMTDIPITGTMKRRLQLVEGGAK